MDNITMYGGRGLPRLSRRPKAAHGYRTQPPPETLKRFTKLPLLRPAEVVTIDQLKPLTNSAARAAKSCGLPTIGKQQIRPAYFDRPEPHMPVLRKAKSGEPNEPGHSKAKAHTTEKLDGAKQPKPAKSSHFGKSVLRILHRAKAEPKLLPNRETTAPEALTCAEWTEPLSLDERAMSVMSRHEPVKTMVYQRAASVMSKHEPRMQPRFTASEEDLMQKIQSCDLQAVQEKKSYIGENIKPPQRSFSPKIAPRAQKKKTGIPCFQEWLRCKKEFDEESETDSESFQNSDIDNDVAFTKGTELKAPKENEGNISSNTRGRSMVRTTCKRSKSRMDSPIRRWQSHTKGLNLEADIKQECETSNSSINEPASDTSDTDKTISDTSISVASSVSEMLVSDVAKEDEGHQSSTIASEDGIQLPYYGESQKMWEAEQTSDATFKNAEHSDSSKKCKDQNDVQVLQKGCDDVGHLMSTFSKAEGSQEDLFCTRGRQMVKVTNRRKLRMDSEERNDRRMKPQATGRTSNVDIVQEPVTSESSIVDETGCRIECRMSIYDQLPLVTKNAEMSIESGMSIYDQFPLVTKNAEMSIESGMSTVTDGRFRQSHAEGLNLEADIRQECVTSNSSIGELASDTSDTDKTIWDTSISVASSVSQMLVSDNAKEDEGHKSSTIASEDDIQLPYYGESQKMWEAEQTSDNAIDATFKNAEHSDFSKKCKDQNDVQVLQKSCDDVGHLMSTFSKAEASQEDLFCTRGQQMVKVTNTRRKLRIDSEELNDRRMKPQATGRTSNVDIVQEPVTSESSIVDETGCSIECGMSIYDQFPLVTKNTEMSIESGMSTVTDGRFRQSHAEGLNLEADIRQECVTSNSSIGELASDTSDTDKTISNTSISVASSVSEMLVSDVAKEDEGHKSSTIASENDIQLPYYGESQRMWEAEQTSDATFKNAEHSDSSKKCKDQNDVQVLQKGCDDVGHLMSTFSKAEGSQEDLFCTRGRQMVKVKNRRKLRMDSEERNDRRMKPQATGRTSNVDIVQEPVTSESSIVDETGCSIECGMSIYDQLPLVTKNAEMSIESGMSIYDQLPLVTKNAEMRRQKDSMNSRGTIDYENRASSNDRISDSKMKTHDQSDIQHPVVSDIFKFKARSSKEHPVVLTTSEEIVKDPKNDSVTDGRVRQMYRTSSRQTKSRVGTLDRNEDRMKTPYQTTTQAQTLNADEPADSTQNAMSYQPLTSSSRWLKSNRTKQVQRSEVTNSCREQTSVARYCNRNQPFDATLNAKPRLLARPQQEQQAHTLKPHAQEQQPKAQKPRVIIDARRIMQEAMRESYERNDITSYNALEPQPHVICIQPRIQIECTVNAPQPEAPDMPKKSNIRVQSCKSRKGRIAMAAMQTTQEHTETTWVKTDSNAPSAFAFYHPRPPSQTRNPESRGQSFRNRRYGMPALPDKPNPDIFTSHGKSENRTSSPPHRDDLLGSHRPIIRSRQRTNRESRHEAYKVKSSISDHQQELASSTAQWPIFLHTLNKPEENNRED